MDGQRHATQTTSPDSTTLAARSRISSLHAPHSCTDGPPIRFDLPRLAYHLQATCDKRRRPAPHLAHESLLLWATKPISRI